MLASLWVFSFNSANHCISNRDYSHTFTYCYDGVNRLTHAVASGSPAYDLAFSYDQYGNASCVAGSGGGVCPALSYDSSTNHVTFIGAFQSPTTRRGICCGTAVPTTNTMPRGG